MNIFQLNSSITNFSLIKTSLFASIIFSNFFLLWLSCFCVINWPLKRNLSIFQIKLRSFRKTCWIFLTDTHRENYSVARSFCIVVYVFRDSIRTLKIYKYAYSTVPNEGVRGFLKKFYKINENSNYIEKFGFRRLTDNITKSINCF